MDVGGDKAIGYLGLEKEENPFLGYRAIRYCLDRPDVFKVQLRALLRAGARQRNIKLMLPLVTGDVYKRQVPGPEGRPETPACPTPCAVHGSADASSFSSLKICR